MLASHFLRVCAPTLNYFDTDFPLGASAAVRTSFLVIFNTQVPTNDSPAAVDVGSNEVTVWSNGFQVNGGIFRDESEVANKALLASLKASVTAKQKDSSGRIIDRSQEVYSGPLEPAQQSADAEPLQEAVNHTLEPPLAAKDATVTHTVTAAVTSAVSMKDAFEANLAKFYQSASAKAAAAGLRVHHSVSSVSPVSPTRHDAIFNANRAMALEMKRMVRSDFMRVIGNAEPADLTEASDPDNSLLASLQNCITGRVAVSVTCSEVFYIEDLATGRLVQGSKGLVHGVEHELVLECCTYHSCMLLYTIVVIIPT
jgi:hypothetical protein